MNGQIWWFMTRASGLVAWLMLTASVLWGIVFSTKAFPNQRRPKWLLSVHRWLAAMTIWFVAIHLVSLIADSYVSFNLVDVAVPYATDWKPGAVALGIVAMWLLLGVEATSLMMKRLPRKVWHGIHFTSYLVFWLTSLHAAFAGTDATSPIYQVTAAASIAAIVWALSYRIATRRAVRRAERNSNPKPMSSPNRLREV